MLARAAAERTSELRQDMHKRTRSRKKKALTDFMRALSDIGVSKRRSAVPSGEQHVYAWLQKPAVTLDSLFDDNSVCLPTPKEYMATCQSQWWKAHEYYYQAIARDQQLREASRHPSKDLSAVEVSAAQHYSEHLIHLLNCQRQTSNAFYKWLARPSTCFLHALVVF